MVAQVIAALLALGGIYISILLQIMRPSSTAADVARALALLAVALLTIIGLLAARRWALPVVVILLTLGAGVMPSVVYTIERRAQADRADARQSAENARHDAKARSRIENRTRDLEERLAANRPYAEPDAQDALEFVNEVSYVDLRYLGLPDRSPVMLDLLKRALAAKLIDPNIMVKGPRPVDVLPEPLFLQVYRADIRPHPDAAVQPRPWEIFKLLVASGADLALAPGHPIAEDLAKTLRQDQWGRYKLD